MKLRLLCCVLMTLFSAAAKSAECGRDYNAATNRYGGFYNTPTHANGSAFAALKEDGTLAAWGDSGRGGSGAPVDAGYIAIYPGKEAFAALKADGSISAWGNAAAGGTGAPATGVYETIASTGSAFAALSADGSIFAWGDAANGGSGAPSGTGYTKIFSAFKAFAALDTEGRISVWGDAANGGSGAPTDDGYVAIYSTIGAFAAMKIDGSITAWGNSAQGGTGAPVENGYTTIYAGGSAFAALAHDGSISEWGDSFSGGSGAPTGAGFHSLAYSGGVFAALTPTGEIINWGVLSSTPPAGSGYQKIIGGIGLSAIAADGSAVTWSSGLSTGSIGGQSYIADPAVDNYVDIFSSGLSNAGIGANGEINMWRFYYFPGQLPTGSGFVNVYSTSDAFAGIKSDGSLIAWGEASRGGAGAPVDSGYISVNGSSDTLSTATCEQTLLLGLWEVTEDIAGNANGRSVSALQINDIAGVHGALVDNQTGYSAAIQAASYADPANPTASEILAVVEMVNSDEGIRRVAEDIAGNLDGQATAAIHLNNSVGVSGALASLEAQYATAFQSASYALRAIPTAEEIQAVLNSVHEFEQAKEAIVDDIAANANGVAATVDQINTFLGADLAQAGLTEHYLLALQDASFNDSTAPSVAEIEAVIRAVNDEHEAPGTGGLEDSSSGGGPFSPVGGVVLLLYLLIRISFGRRRSSHLSL